MPDFIAFRPNGMNKNELSTIMDVLKEWRNKGIRKQKNKEKERGEQKDVA